MVDYYKQFDLDTSASSGEIQEQLTKERRKWTQRLNAPDLKKRQVAEQTLADIDDALTVFKTDESTTEYVAQVFKQRLAPMAEKVIKAVEKPAANTDPVDQAQSLYDNDNFAETINFTKKAISSGNNHVHLHRLLIYSHSFLNQGLEAVEAGEAAALVHPDDIDIRVSLSNIYLYSFKNTERASVHVRAAEKIDSTSFYVRLARLRYNLHVNGCNAAAIKYAKVLHADFNSTPDIGDEIANCFTAYSDIFIYYNNYDQPYEKNQKEFTQFYKARKATILFSKNQRYLEMSNYVTQMNKKAPQQPVLIVSGFASLFTMTLLDNSYSFIAAIMAFVAVFLTGVLIYTGFEPYWAMNTKQCTGKDNTVSRFFDTTFFIINNVIDIISTVIKFIITAIKQITNKS